MSSAELEFPVVATNQCLYEMNLFGRFKEKVSSPLAKRDSTVTVTLSYPFCVGSKYRHNGILQF
ncbi:ABC transporter substrate-binding protein [Sesbania bispinosa]|nr:ABC transporter substrate-binding protein [Sesbania bispinosa]